MSPPPPHHGGKTRQVEAPLFQYFLDLVVAVLILGHHAGEGGDLVYRDTDVFSEEFFGIFVDADLRRRRTGVDDQNNCCRHGRLLTFGGFASNRGSIA